MSDQAEHLLVGYPMEVRRQVWQSLVNMLRVYAHAATLNGSAQEVTSNADSACVKCGDCALGISFSAESGASSWRITQSQREEWGEFRIDEHGTLLFPVGPKELDAAAIDWIEQLGRSASAPNMNP